MKPNNVSKRFLSFVLSAFLLIPMFAMPVSAEPKDTRTADAVAQKLSVIYDVPLSIDQTEKLKKFNGGENYLLITFEGSGYAIVHRSTGQIVEAGVESPNPYQGVAKNTKVYGGIMNYAYKLKGKYYMIGFDDNADTLISDEAKEANIAQLSVYENLAEKQADAAPGSKGISATAKTTNPGGAGTPTYINNYSYIRTMDFGNNVNNTCGSVAAGMLLTFYQVHRGVTVLPAQYRPGSTLTSPTSSAEALHQNLQSYCEYKIGEGSDACDVVPGINNRQDSWFGTSKKVTAVTTSATSTTKTAMNQDKPVMLNVKSWLGSTFGNHWLLGYAWWAEGSTTMYMAHNGWKGTSKNTSAIVNQNWMSEIVYLNMN